jgi:hypothetical protein
VKILLVRMEDNIPPKKHRWKGITEDIVGTSSVSSVIPFHWSSFGGCCLPFALAKTLPTIAFTEILTIISQVFDFTFYYLPYFAFQLLGVGRIPKECGDLSSGLVSYIII